LPCFSAAAKPARTPSWSALTDAQTIALVMLVSMVGQV
jgi:hypothetical protein